jgi:hypothetical protein
MFKLNVTTQRWHKMQNAPLEWMKKPTTKTHLQKRTCKWIIYCTGPTWTAVELHRLRNVAGAESDPLTDFRQHLRVLRQVVARQNRVQISTLEFKIGVLFKLPLKSITMVLGALQKNMVKCPEANFLLSVNKLWISLAKFLNKIVMIFIVFWVICERVRHELRIRWAWTFGNKNLSSCPILNSFKKVCS